MPNWMTSEVRITGPDDEIARFRAAHISKDEDGEDILDFNSVIPMPLELKGTQAGACIDALVWALGGELCAERDLLRKLGMCSAADTPFDLPWVQDLGITTREKLLSWAGIERTEALDAARRALELERSTGYRNWYDPSLTFSCHFVEADTDIDYFETYTA